MTAVLAAVVGGRAEGRAAASTSLVLYSVATGVQFINNADDEARGAINNPFNSSTSKLEPKIGFKGNGPFPGDVTVYAFDLYTNGSLAEKAGTASYTCYFNHAEHAFCMAYYQLGGHSTGTVVASGPVDFAKTGFTLVVTGGTRHYLAATGQVEAVAASHNAQRLSFRLDSATVKQLPTSFKVVSSPTTAQFMNHADDRLRGMTNNPFAVNAQAIITVTKGAEKGNGPFPGDDVLYSFDLHPSGHSARTIGTGIFTCYFLFNKSATCDAYLSLRQGTLLASGAIPFNSSHFTLDVTGGTDRFLGRVGAIVAHPAAGNGEQLTVTLT